MSVIKKSAVLVAGFLGMFVGSARAQETVVVKVPFSFVVRGEEFPAGRYDITIESGNLAIRGMDNGSGIFALTLPAGGRDPVGSQPALVFTRHENEYLLTQVWESPTVGLELWERSVVRRRAEAQPVGSDAPTVVVAANWR